MIRFTTESWSRGVAALFVCAAIPACDEPAPKAEAIAPKAQAPVVENEVPSPGAASRPALPKPDSEKSVECEPLTARAANLAARCFKLVPDNQACTEFFPIVEELQAGGCDTTSVSAPAVRLRPEADQGL